MTDGTTLAFDGFNSSFGLEVPLEEKINQSITITGKPVLTTAT